MDISYKKQNNSQLFKNFNNHELLNIEICQNYIPLYNRFFTLNNTNYNNINLNNKNSIVSISEKNNENCYKGVIKNEDITKQILIFVKFAPLLDPYKYLAGKYDNNDNIFILPQFDNNKCYEKVYDPNNSAYVDSFFTYLTSQLLNHKDFIHGLDYYGSFLGIKNEYHIDIGDDLDMLSNSDFFHKNKHLYTFINRDHEELLNEQSRSNKKVISVGDEINNLSILNLETLNILETDNLETDNLETDNLETDNLETDNLETDNLKNEKKKNINFSKCNNSDVSSRSSNTHSMDEEDASSMSNKSDSSNSLDSLDNSEPENIMISLKKFPVGIICLECCENTFDYLLTNNKIKDEELSSIIIQILMILITYQNVFNLTHNDLHTNNIMYIPTSKQYLYYKYNEKHYKVPTFGKIFKIIDFGRAIYKYKDNLICSDSFHTDGDAATQYNFGEYYNDKKVLVEPNMSFDLCRLGCSIYDFIMDKYENSNNKMSSIDKIIINWCVDDDGRNILYKNNNEERYPDFKLYKMIARKVHNHTPHKEIDNKVFAKYIVAKKEIKKGSKIMNIDLMNEI
jgi:hypothetical protein